jgi:hypothetical protein
MVPISSTPEVPHVPLNFVHSPERASNLTTSVDEIELESIFVHWKVAFAFAVALLANMTLIPS